MFQITQEWLVRFYIQQIFSVVSDVKLGLETEYSKLLSASVALTKDLKNFLFFFIVFVL